MPGSCLIIGCGYVGLPLALRLMAQGMSVTGWGHSSASAEALKAHPFARFITGSVGHAPLWESVTEQFDVVIHCASSNRGGSEVYQEVFAKGGLLMNNHQAQARRLMVSSTSVYGEKGGEVVTEETPASAPTMTAKILRMAEEGTRASGGIVVRSAGIYGPGRGVLFEKFRRGEAVIEGDGSRWLNQIHRDDLVSALEHIITHGQPGEIYNAADDTPVMLRDYYAWCAEFLNQPLPPHGPVDPNRKRGLTSKRVSNVKLRATGWTPRYPSFREGLTSVCSGGL